MPTIAPATTDTSRYNRNKLKARYNMIKSILNKISIAQHRGFE